MCAEGATPLSKFFAGAGANFDLKHLDVVGLSLYWEFVVRVLDECLVSHDHFRT